MSIKSATLFIDRMNTDEEFANRVTECKDAGTRMAFVKDLGFNFTIAEVKEIKGNFNDVKYHHCCNDKKNRIG